MIDCQLPPGAAGIESIPDFNKWSFVVCPMMMRDFFKSRRMQVLTFFLGLVVGIAVDRLAGSSSAFRNPERGDAPAIPADAEGASTNPAVRSGHLGSVINVSGGGRQADAENDNAERFSSGSKPDLRHALESRRLLQDFAQFVVAGTGYELPEGAAATAAFAGDFHRFSADFRDKWKGKVPDEKSPEYATFARERDELAQDMADVTKSFIKMGFPDSIKSQPSKIAEFQSLQVISSLKLPPEPARQVSAVLCRRYAEVSKLGLSLSNRPAGDSDLWDKRRKEFAAGVYAEVINALPPEKRQEFDRLYGRDFFGTITVGFQ